MRTPPSRPIGMTSNHRLPPLRHALLHPVWIAAVAALAINDHLLKGSDLLPGWFTGKLSDVVGLFAAPLLLAVLVRARSRASWALAHFAIGVVFACIQLSGAAADAWSAVMGLVGFPWSITSDPTDLLALPALLSSYAWVPRLAQTGSASYRTGEVVVASAGVLACVATSPGPEGPLYSAFSTDTYLHNANPYDIVLRIRPLASSTTLDCDLAEEDPARYLRDGLFGEASAWTLAPDATMPVLESWERELRGCHAVWIDADNLPPSVIFWREGQIPEEWVDGTGITPDTRGWISIAYDDGGSGEYETEESLVFPIGELPIIDAADACTPTGPESRLAWGGVPTGEWRLGAASEGPDGCLQLDLRTGFEDELDQQGKLWELCLPPGAFPFEAGDILKLRQLGLGVGNEAAELMRLDPLTGAPGTTMVVWRGDASATVFDVQPIVTLRAQCDAIAGDACGTVRQAVDVSIAGGGFETAQLSARPDASVVTNSDTHQLEVFLVHGSERLIANPDCSGDPVGYDIELVAIRRDRGGE